MTVTPATHHIPRLPARHAAAAARLQEKTDYQNGRGGLPSVSSSLHFEFHGVLSRLSMRAQDAGHGPLGVYVRV